MANPIRRRRSRRNPSPRRGHQTNAAILAARPPIPRVETTRQDARDSVPPTGRRLQAAPRRSASASSISAIQATSSPRASRALADEPQIARRRRRLPRLAHQRQRRRRVLGRRVLVARQHGQFEQGRVIPVVAAAAAVPAGALLGGIAHHRQHLLQRLARLVLHLHQRHRIDPRIGIAPVRLEAGAIGFDGALEEAARRESCGRPSSPPPTGPCRPGRAARWSRCSGRYSLITSMSTRSASSAARPG